MSTRSCQRSQDGLAAARARGLKGGRKSALTERQAASIRKQYGEGITVSALAEDFKVSHPTIYRALETATV